MNNILNTFYSFFRCFDTNEAQISSEIHESLKIPLLSSKHTTDETIINSKNKPMIVQLVSLVLKKKNILVSNIFIDGDNLIVEVDGSPARSFLIETLRVEGVVRFSCTINFGMFFKS